MDEHRYSQIIRYRCIGAYRELSCTSLTRLGKSYGARQCQIDLPDRGRAPQRQTRPTPVDTNKTNRHVQIYPLHMARSRRSLLRYSDLLASAVPQDEVRKYLDTTPEDSTQPALNNLLQEVANRSKNPTKNDAELQTTIIRILEERGLLSDLQANGVLSEAIVRRIRANGELESRGTRATSTTSTNNRNSNKRSDASRLLLRIRARPTWETFPRNVPEGLLPQARVAGRNTTGLDLPFGTDILQCFSTISLHADTKNTITRLRQLSSNGKQKVTHKLLKEYATECRKLSLPFDHDQTSGVEDDEDEGSTSRNTVDGYVAGGGNEGDGNAVDGNAAGGSGLSGAKAASQSVAGHKKRQISVLKRRFDKFDADVQPPGLRTRPRASSEGTGTTKVVALAHATWKDRGLQNKQGHITEEYPHMITSTDEASAGSPLLTSAAPRQTVGPDVDGTSLPHPGAWSAEDVRLVTNLIREGNEDLMADDGVEEPSASNKSDSEAGSQHRTLRIQASPPRGDDTTLERQTQNQEKYPPRHGKEFSSRIAKRPRLNTPPHRDSVAHVHSAGSEEQFHTPMLDDLCSDDHPPALRRGGDKGSEPREVLIPNAEIPELDRAASAMAADLRTSMTENPWSTEPSNSRPQSDCKSNVSTPRLSLDRRDTLLTDASIEVGRTGHKRLSSIVSSEESDAGLDSEIDDDESIVVSQPSITLKTIVKSGIFALDKLRQSRIREAAAARSQTSREQMEVEVQALKNQQAGIQGVLSALQSIPSSGAEVFETSRGHMATWLEQKSKLGEKIMNLEEDINARRNEVKASHQEAREARSKMDSAAAILMSLMEAGKEAEKILDEYQRLKNET